MGRKERKYLHTSFAITFTYLLEQIFNKIWYTFWSVAGKTGTTILLGLTAHCLLNPNPDKSHFQLCWLDNSLCGKLLLQHKQDAIQPSALLHVSKFPSWFSCADVEQLPCYERVISISNYDILYWIWVTFNNYSIDCNRLYKVKKRQLYPACCFILVWSLICHSSVWT